MGNGKTADFSSATYSAHARHALLFATNSCTRKVFFKRMENPLKWLLVLFVTEKYEKRKVTSWFFTGEQCSPLPFEFKVQHVAKTKNFCPIRFFFCICRRKRKSYQKENAEIEISRSAERDRRHRRLVPPSPKGGRKLYYGAGSFRLWAKKQKIPKKRASSNI